MEFCKQHDGVAMVFLVRPILANLFLCYNEKVLLQNCPSEFKPGISRRYLMILLCSKHHIVKFRNDLNRQEQQIYFGD